MTGTIFFKYHLMEIYWAEQIMSWQFGGGKASAHFGAYSNIYILFQMPNRDKADLKPMFENMQFSTIGNLISRNQKQLQKYLLKLLSWKQ